MSDYDKEQKTEMVPQHKRLAVGVPLTGESMQPKGEKTQSNNESKSKGGLSQYKK
jgi:hypothetical protein